MTEFAHHCPEEFFIAFVKTVVSFVILARINVLLTVIIFVLIPVMAVSCSYFNLQVRKAFKRQRNHIGELNARIEDSLLGNKVVRAFANEAVEIGKFNRDNQEFLKIKRQTYKYMAAFQNTIRMFDGLMYVVVIVAGGIFMIKGLIMPADLVAYTLYVTTLLSTIRRIIEFAEQFQRGMTGIERFTELMDANIDIFDEEGAVPLRDVEGEITFKHVSFEYPDDHTPVLSDINLTIKPGEKVALVGPSGGGKTTLCNLIPRFYDPTEGEILLDGQNIRNVTLESLRSNVGVVQQDVYLFSGSVYENIAYGKPGATRVKISSLPPISGVPTATLRSKRPGRRIAGSRISTRLVAAITIMPSLTPKPSISTSNWFRVCSLSSCPPPIPVPRRLATASISSINTIQGALCFASSNRSRTREAPTPTNISTKSDPEMLKNGTPASPATALASKVLPVPGGPSNRTPLGILAPTPVYFPGSFRKSTISSSSSFSSFRPAT